ncbi:MAG: type II secretion system protein [Candidatus Riflebacteria bacterium]
MTVLNENSIMCRRGVTLIEILLAVIMLSMLFGSGYSIMTYSRRETEKGFWIQQAITQLRNGSRAITQKLKMTSYPSTIIRQNSGAAEVQKVIAYKEKREYDYTGRLRKIEVNNKTDFDMHAIITHGGGISPTFEDQSIMHFPVCTPETEDSAGYEEGKIVWVELVLRPSREYRLTGLGTLHMIERHETYSTKALPDRVFALDKKFDKSLPIKTDKVLIDDVREVGIDYFDVKEFKGRGVSKEGVLGEKRFLKRILVTMDITCSHPKDGKIWLSDQCSVINNVEIVELAASNLMELLAINGNSADIKFNGTTMTVTENQMVGTYRVTKILADAVIMVTPGSEIERYLTLKSS